MGRKSSGPHLISVSASGRHSEGLADVASLDPQGSAAIRSPAHFMERCLVVSYARHSTTGRAGVCYRRGSSLERTSPGLCKTLHSNEVLRSRSSGRSGKVSDEAETWQNGLNSPISKKGLQR